MDFEQYLTRQRTAIQKNKYSKIKINELFVFARQFHTLLKAGIPLFRSIEIIISQTQNKHLKYVCLIIKSELLEGSSLSDAMKLFPHIFPNFFISLISVGETRGNIDESFNRMATYLDKKRELQNKIVNALIYPVILIATGLVVITLLISFVLPKFVSIFIQNETPLPFITQITLGISAFITSHYIIILACIMASVAGIGINYNTPKGRLQFDQIIIKLPVIGPIVYNIAIIRFARTLGILYGSGIALITSIEMARDIMGNLYLGGFINQAIKSVKEGKGVAGTLNDSGQFPPILVEMIGTGEETGTLDTLAVEAADFLDNETEYIIRRQIAYIEPIALIFIGGLIVIIAASLLLPIFRLASSIHH
ncbi:MAG: hypothetical protein A2X42_10010 [Candidatus Margulisbacteria bacterium GWF2_38_17]|nr:MAG: hypothetical protein A2X43_07725 [Candidatus Margulisbacteria bacterium GWD2_39_127]OGI03888.1 MAG: hypothetical protein A2X42_10010 [Candidatus Margulisbacteria bacterium GWF2_38_17]OGI08807.1 MAG: hypothetical protein A2X41_05105 [Candidatus Margulisbacteria bacterium GWE2_39_32]